MSRIASTPALYVPTDLHKSIDSYMGKAHSSLITKALHATKNTIEITPG